MNLVKTENCGEFLLRFLDLWLERFIAGDRYGKNYTLKVPVSCSSLQVGKIEVLHECNVRLSVGMFVRSVWKDFCLILVSFLS
jgi:hypothetical protein